MDIEIYIATHKPAPFPEDRGYIPIQNGKAVAGVDLRIRGDDTGDNISARMPTFSECCALYWMWKNVSTEVVGLAHYRRYFSPINRAIRTGEFDVAASTDFPEIGEVDLIVSHPIDFGHLSVEVQYAISAQEQDLVSARGAVRKLYPDYLAAFDEVMEGSLLTPYNLFVGKLPVMREFCAWMFDILFLLEKWIPHQTYEGYQKRVFAFLSERLFTVWLRRNEVRYRFLTRHVMALSY